VKKVRRWLVNGLLILLLLIGLMLIFNKSIRNFLIAHNANQYQISKVDKKTLKKNNKKGVGSFDFEAVRAVSFEDVMKNQLNKQQLPVIGGIAIPDLGINLPIFRGLGNIELSYGAGTMKEEQVMGQGNYALASHHLTGVANASKLLFTPLERAEAGMMIYVTDKTMIYLYKIREKNIVTPEHVEVIADHPGKREITLVTCEDAKATRRIIVTGDYISEMPFATAKPKILGVFEKTYNQFLDF
jgi:sortase A